MIELSDKREESSYWNSENNFQFYLCLDCLLNKEESIVRKTHDWRAEWGYQALFSRCSSNKEGVAILFLTITSLFSS